jgi:rod shape-determining protein MreC
MKHSGYWKKWGIAALLLLFLGLLAAATLRRGAVNRFALGMCRPFLVAGTRASLAVQGLIQHHLNSMQQVQQQVVGLEKQVSELEAKLYSAETARRENRELRRLLELPVPPKWRRITAPVIAREAATWNLRFRLGKGTRQGITLGSAVLVGPNVVGRVTEVTPLTAMVTTVASPACQLSVRIKGANALGIVAGFRRSSWFQEPVCIVNYLPRDRDYQRRSLVETSGLGGGIPEGLPVGYVVPWPDTSISRVVDAAYVQLAARPAADFESFRYVAVVSPELTTD